MNQRIFYLVTGMAGAGKSTVLNALEDSGFYCVDNLPAALFDKFFELLAETSESRQKVALAVDMRSGAQFSRIIGSLKILDIHQIPFRLIFLNCEDHILVKRFKETRRRHPLYKGNLLEAIQKERRLLRDLLDNADMVLDTSGKTSNLIPTIIYSKGGNDLTDEVVAILNKGHEQEVADWEKEKAAKLAEKKKAAEKK